MDLENLINQKIKEAMLNKQEIELRSLRAIKSEILLAKTSKGSNTEITHEDEMKLIQKLIKQRKDSAEIFKQQNREDLLTKELDEIKVFQSFLPKQLTVEEIEKEIQTIITENNITNISEMGKVIGLANKKLLGKADGKTISEVVKKKLQ